MFCTVIPKIAADALFAAKCWQLEKICVVEACLLAVGWLVLLQTLRLSLTVIDVYRIKVVTNTSQTFQFVRSKQLLVESGAVQGSRHFIANCSPIFVDKQNVVFITNHAVLSLICVLIAARNVAADALVVW